MIDIHTHITPSIDDGADSFYEAADMINIASENGTDELVLTPHFPNGKFKLSDSTSFKTEIDKFISFYYDKYGTDRIKLYSGAEIFSTEDIIPYIEERKIPTINGTNYVLTEFSTNIHFSQISEILKVYLKNGYTPVLAHTERYECLRRDFDRVVILKKMGVVIQLNAETILIDDEEIEFMKFLLMNRLIDVVASDTHEPYLRSPDMSEANMRLSLMCSSDYAIRVFTKNPKCIIEGKPINTGDVL